MRTRLTSFFVFLASASFAQQIENLTPILTGDRIEITYDLIDNEGRTYDLQLYSSFDNYTSPLKYVSGDIGPEVSTGPGKKVIWEAKKELTEMGKSKGEVYLEIRGPATPPLLNISTPGEGQKIPRGKSTKLEWQSKSKSQLRIYLYKSGSASDRIGTVPNTGSYEWTVPKDLEKGPGYNFVFTLADNPNKAFESPQFIIKPKYGMGLKVGLGAILVGVGVCVISPETCGKKPPPDTIPYPIEPN